MTDDLLVSRAESVWTLSLNRPDRLNALTTALRAALLQALDAAGADEHCRAVLLRGEGRGFCAGQDLADVPDGIDLGALLEAEYAPIVRAIRVLPKPVVCAVHGVAAGAGANIALSCDFVLAAASARFIQSFIQIGLIPDASGTWLLPRLAGAARARGMALLGQPVLAPQAEAWGLIWRSVPDDDLATETETLAAKVAALPTHAIALAKRAFDASESSSLEQQLALEARLQGEAGRSPDFAEGVRAFKEKRPPNFTGRPP